MRTQNKGIIFDFDGIIYDSEQINYEANDFAFEGTGISFSPEEYKQLWIVEGLDLPEIVNRYRMNVDPEELRQRKNLRCREIYLRSASIIADDVRGAVAALVTQQWKTAIGSSNTEENILTLLDRSDMRKFFDVVVGLESVPTVKPAPDVFRECLKRIRVRAKNAVVVEDAPKGIIAARRAKIGTIIAMPNAWTKNCDFSEADMVITSIRDLPDAIK